MPFDFEGIINLTRYSYWTLDIGELGNLVLGKLFFIK